MLSGPALFSPTPRRRFSIALCVCLSLLLTAPAFASKKQDAKAAAQAAQAAPVRPVGPNGGPVDPKGYLQEQFGPMLAYLPQYPPIVGDFDSDGAEDLVLVVTGKDPLIDQQQFNYKAIDPYNAFFGWSDPKDTIQFAASEAEPRFVVIVQNWRAATPKAKWVVINLSFDKLSSSRYLSKKNKVVPAIELEDRTGLTSDLFWNGKQWKWADKSLRTE
jgi:hypothetical protein